MQGAQLLQPPKQGPEDLVKATVAQVGLELRAPGPRYHDICC
jgi:hypothetical protein